VRRFVNSAPRLLEDGSAAAENDEVSAATSCNIKRTCETEPAAPEAQHFITHTPKRRFAVEPGTTLLIAFRRRKPTSLDYAADDGDATNDSNR
jgi:hypothetical protein